MMFCQHPEIGKRAMRLSSVALLEGDDANEMRDGEEITLKNWGNVKISRIERGDGGTYASRHAKYWPLSPPCARVAISSLHVKKSFLNCSAWYRRGDIFLRFPVTFVLLLWLRKRQFFLFRGVSFCSRPVAGFLLQ